MNSGIYSIVNTVNNKQYIGSTNNFIIRKRSHFNLLRNNKHFSFHLQASFNKYGESIFEFRIIFECRVKYLLEREDYYIDLYKTLDPNFGYNLQNATRTFFTKEVREKIRAKAIGRTASQNTKEKMSVSAKDIWKVRMENPKIAKKFKKILGMANKGKIFNKEWKEKMSMSQKNRQAKIRLTGIVNKQYIPVIGTNIITGEIKKFLSIGCASRFIRNNKSAISHISDCIKGKHKTALGYTWKKDEVKQ